MDEALLKKPARDLKPQEAFDLVTHHIDHGDIERFDKVRMEVGGRIKLKPRLAGVEFCRALEFNKGDFGSVGANAGVSINPRLEFAIVVYRLAKVLAEKWTVNKIVWGGLSHGKNDKTPLNNHNDGRGLDFYGATTSDGRDFDVRRDWWRRKVYRKEDNKPITNPARSWDQWNNVISTYYRLAHSIDPNDNVPGRFFADVYEFAMTECRVGTKDVKAESFRDAHSLQSGFIVHPDYPVYSQRSSHNDHMHFQLGKT